MRVSVVRPQRRTVLVLALVVALVAGAAALRAGRSGPPPAGPTAGAAAPAATSAAAAAVAACGRARAPRQLRGMWLTTVNNIDFPSRPGLSRDEVQAEYRGWLDLAERQRHNAIFVHVRPSGDAFWPSALAPWSEWLTGNRDGRDPGWDPLEFMITEAHARNLQFHAWFNPYRASQPAPAGAGTALDRLAPGHPLRAHPEWAVAYPTTGAGARLYYDPGIPEARRHVEDAILDAVTRYDVDGVHFDDFFYPYPVAGQDFGDAASHARHGGGTDRAAWRRGNVDTFVREMAERIRAAKPWVAFGISPFGIWRNAATDPAGSPTRGLQSYDAIYADTRLWVRSEWLDYVVPQLYWPIGFEVADYAKLLPWWAETVAGTRVQLYIGQADYRLGEEGPWRDPAELDRQLALAVRHQVTGFVHFSAKQVRDDRLGAVTRYRDAHYAAPAVPPRLARLPAVAPAAPQVTQVRRDPSGTVTVGWRAGGGAPPTSWALHRVDPDGVRLVATGRTPTATDPAAPPQDRPYCLSVLDRAGTESAPAAAVVSR